MNALSARIPAQEIGRRDQALVIRLRASQEAASKTGQAMTAEETRSLGETSFPPGAKEAMVDYYRFVASVDPADVSNPKSRAAVVRMQQAIERSGGIDTFAALLLAP